MAEGDELLRELWTLGGQALDAAPIDSAPRLYIESLNDTIDMGTVRLSALDNRVPGPVLALEVLGAAFAMGLLAVYLSILGRGVIAVVLGADPLVTLLMLVTFDLDRPTRGLIVVPDTPLTGLRASMDLPPAGLGPDGIATPGALSSSPPRARASRAPSTAPGDTRRCRTRRWAAPCRRPPAAAVPRPPGSSACSTPAARSGAVAHVRERHVRAAVHRTAATPTIAQSCARRWNFR